MLAVIQLINSPLEAFGENEMFFLHALCDYAAIAIDNARAVEKIQELTITDEAFYTLTMAKTGTLHVLANNEIPGTPSAGSHKGEVVPQIWTYEHTPPGGRPARAFVWMQGHTYANFANESIQKMLLRAIAWAGNHPTEELLTYTPPPRRPRQ